MGTSRVWVVRSVDPPMVGHLVALAGGDPRAIAEGRVFIGRRRVLASDELLKPGDRVTIAAASVALAEDRAPIVLLADAEGLVAADKPAGIPTIPDHGGHAHALVTRVAEALSVAPSSLHPTSRLDRGVSGVVIFARTASAAAHLKAARQAGAYDRRYLAIAAQAPSPVGGTWDEPIGRAGDPRKRQVRGREATAARTRYATVGAAASPAKAALLALSPITGRTHQLRVHASHAGAPLLGDRDYGGPTRVTSPRGTVLPLARIALHAARVRIPRADGSGVLEIVSTVPEALRALWLTLGGAPGAWDSALAWTPPDE